MRRFYRTTRELSLLHRSLDSVRVRSSSRRFLLGLLASLRASWYAGGGQRRRRRRHWLARHDGARVAMVGVESAYRRRRRRRYARVFEIQHCTQTSLFLIDGNATPRAILTGHEHPIVCVAVSGTHGLVASGSQGRRCLSFLLLCFFYALYSLGGICLLHATSGDLLRSLTTPTGLTRPHLAAFGCDGQVVFQYSDGSGYVGVFSCNGKLLVHRSVDEQLLVGRGADFFPHG